MSSQTGTLLILWSVGTQTTATRHRPRQLKYLSIYFFNPGLCPHRPGLNLHFIYWWSVGTQTTATGHRPRQLQAKGDCKDSHANLRPRSSDFRLQTNPPFPWDKIILIKQHRFRNYFTASRFNAIFQDIFAHLFDRFFAFNYRTTVDINDITHSLR